MLGWKPIAVNTYIKEEERSQTNNPNLIFWEAKRKKETKSKDTKKELIKFRAETNEIDHTKTIEAIQWKQKLVLGKVNKVSKPLAKLIRKKEDTNKSETIKGHYHESYRNKKDYS